MKKIYIVGIGMGNPETITLKGKRIIEESPCLIGAKRMLDSFPEGTAERKDLILSTEILKWIQEDERWDSYAILMSGDVGFFSGAKKLVEGFNEEEYQVELIPGISSLQYFSAKIKKPWTHTKIISLHDQKRNFLGEIQENEYVFLLTGAKRTVKEICREMVTWGLTQVKVYVGERLSYEEERVTVGSPKELMEREFHSLSVMIVENHQYQKEGRKTPGIEDEQFIRGKVPMTKWEIRAVAMGKLDIEEDDILYDIGGGTGSVSVEMALQALKGKVFSIETNKEGVECIRKNKEKFKAHNLKVIEGRAPEALEGLPAPSKVFIGGSKGELERILKVISLKNPKAQIVIDAIALESAVKGIEQLKKHGFDQTSVSQIFSARDKSVGGYTMMMGQNPVFIISGKEKDHED